MLSLIVLSVLPGVAWSAGDSPVLDRGTRRATLAFEFSSSETDFEGAGTIDEDTIDLEGDIGWFVAPQVEVGATGIFSNSESDDGSGEVESTLYGLGPFARYDFTTGGAAIPFVDARIAYTDLELDIGGSTVDGDGFQWAGGVGVLAPLSSSVAIETTARYFDGDFDLDSVDVEQDGFALLVGLTAFF